MKTNELVFFSQIRKNTTAFFTSVCTALFFSLALVLPIFKNTLSNVTGVSDFSEHINSQASAHNVDIGARVNQYYLMILLAVVLFAAIGFGLFQILKNKKIEAQGKTGFHFVRNISLLGAVSLIVTLLLNYKLEEFALAIAVFIIPVFIGLLFILRDHYAKRNFDMLVLSLSLSVIMTVFIGTMLQKLGLSSDLYILAVAVMAGAVSLVLYLLFQSRLVKNPDRVILAAIPFLLTALAQSLCLEGLNIINKRFNIVLNIQYPMYAAIVLISIVLYFTIRGKRKKTRTQLIYKLYLPITVLTIGMLIGQPARMAAAGGEFFEYANAGLSVHQFFRFGSLPIIESFDAHMLFAQFFGFIEGLLNGYEVWTEGLYHGLYMPIYALLTYTLLKKVIGEAESFVFVLGFPLLRMVFFEIYIIPVIMILAIEKLIKTDKPWQRFVFIIVCVVLCLYRLDVGVAAMISGILAYCLVNLSGKEIKRIGTLALAGAIALLFAVALYAAICTLKGISPILRAKEFMIAAGSSQNWGYAQSGDRTLFVYNLVYSVMPISLAAVTLWFCYRYFIVDKKEGYDKTRIAAFLFFVVFYYFNLSRGIVRHSLIEYGSIWFIAGTYFLSLVTVTAVKPDRQNMIARFSAVILVSVMIFGISYPSLNSDDVRIPNITYGNHSLTHYAVSSQNYQSQYAPQEPMNGTRVKGESHADVATFKTLVDTVLTEDQTYMDAASVNYFYALTDKKNPFYVNQMPMMLNGDSGQRMAINEVKKVDAPLALVPIYRDSDEGIFFTAIDGITLDYKFYKVYEYVYANYVPLVRLSEIDVYCLPEKRDEYAALLSDKFKLIDGCSEFWKRPMGYLPLLWGEKDGKNIYQQVKGVEPALSGIAGFESEPFAPVNKAMNLVIEIAATAELNAEVTLSADGTPAGNYKFFVSEGTHRYVIRLSTNYAYWSADMLKLAFSLTSPVDILSLGMVDDDGGAYTLGIME